MNLSWVWPILPQRRGCSQVCRKAKGDNKVENKSEGLLGQGVSVVSTLSLLHVLGV